MKTFDLKYCYLKFNIHKVIALTTIILLSITVVMLILMIGEETSNVFKSPMALNEIIGNDSMELMNESVDVTQFELNKNLESNLISSKALGLINNSTEVDTSSLNRSQQEIETESNINQEIQGRSVEGADEPDTEQSIDPYSIIASDIEAIKSMDKAVISRYFGDSDIFSADIVGDKLAATLTSFISSGENEEGNIETIIHICTLDYNKMLDANKKLKEELINKGEVDESSINEQIKKELAKGVVKGDFDIHYNIPVEIVDNQVKVTEELKQAITGGWYNGINTDLQPVSCPLDTNS